MNKFKWGCVAVVIANLCATIEGVEMKKVCDRKLKMYSRSYYKSGCIQFFWKT